MHLEIRSSSKPNKKYDAIFTRKDKTTKIIPFGDKKYQDYTEHKNKKRRDLYLLRHRKNENWNNPETAGALSRYILWGDYTDIQKNIKAFKTRFGFQ